MSAERLSGLDASFLYIETPTLHMHVAITAVFDPETVPGGYSFRRFRRHIHDRLPLAPVFQRRLAEVPLGLGHPLWVDDPDFDIDNHLHRAALPAPGGIQELAEFTGQVTSTKLDRNRPLWEIWLVEGLADGNIALIGKIHHATVDGVSGAELLGVLLDLHPETPGTDATETPAIDTDVPSPLDLVAGALVQRAGAPVDFVRTVWRTGEALLGISRARRSEDTGRAALPLTAPRTSINTAVTSRRRVAYAAVNLADVKALKNAAGVTVNDVVLAIATSALRTYLMAGDELPDDPLVAVVPVSVRPEIGDQRGANKVSAMFIGLPTEEPASLERLLRIHDGTKGAKEEHKALGASTLQDWVEHSSPSVFAAAARFYTGMKLAERHRPIANLVISNVPGPDFPLYLGGAEMLASFPLGPVMDGMGLNITIMSYRGVLYWGFISCARAVPRLWDIASAVPAALDEMLADAGLEPAPFESPLNLGPGMSHRAHHLPSTPATSPPLTAPIVST